MGALEPEFYRQSLAGLGVRHRRLARQADEATWPRLRELIAAVVRGRTRQEWIDIFAGTDGCVSPVLDFEEAAVDPHNAEREVYRRVDGVLHPMPAPRLERRPRAPSTPPRHPMQLAEIRAEWVLVSR